MEYKHIYFEITGQCNSSCAYCGVKGSNAEISLSRLLDTFSEFLTMGGSELTLSGGEPLLYSNLYPLFDAIGDLNIVSSIITNGKLVNKEFIQKCAKIDMGICVSFDGTNQQIADSFRGAGSFASADIALSLINKIGYHRTAVSVVPNSQNYLNMYDIVEYCIQNKISIMHLSLPESRHNGETIFQSLLTNDASMQVLTDFIIEMIVNPPQGFKLDITDNGVFSRCILLETKKVNTINDILGKSLKVTCEGDVFPTVLTDNTKYRLGNIYENSLKDILSSSKLSSLYEELRKRDTSFCEKCIYTNQCNGGIISYYLNQPKESMVDPFCQFRIERIPLFFSRIVT